MNQIVSRASIKRWMEDNVADFIDGGEVQATALAEAAARQFEIDYENGPLDDSDHWLWELPLEIQLQPA